MFSGGNRRILLAAAVAVWLGCPPGPSLGGDLGAVSPLPLDGASARAYQVLEQHCARCHQAGRLTRRLAAGKIGNILNLDVVAQRPDLVRRGHPDASVLFTVMQTRHMPNDLTGNAGSKGEPSIEEIGAVRDWIAGLAAEPACEAGATEGRELDTLIRADQQGADPETARYRRYVQLSHLEATCGGAARLHAYRQAVVKLLNSVSRMPTPVSVDNVEATDRVLAFDVRRLGWSLDEWDALAKQTPKATRPDFGPDILASTGSRHPLVRADWLAHAFSDPGVYYARLKLPAREVGLDQWFGFTGNIEVGSTRIAGIARSGVTGGARAFLRRTVRDDRVFWKAFDFDNEAGAGSGVLARLSDRESPHASEKELRTAAMQSRALFQLPNGFFGAAVFSSDGARRDVVKEAQSALHSGGLTGHQEGGLGCLVCHQPALLPFKDDLRDSMPEASDGAPVNGLEGGRIVSQAELDALLANDANAEALAHRAAGIDPELRIDGFEPIHALALNYERDLDIARAARELGITVKRLEQGLEKLDGELAPPARRLRQGVVTRAEFDRLAAELVGSEGGSGFTVDEDADDADAMRLSLWSDKPSYKVGDTAFFFASSTQDCHLTMISVDAEGVGTVIFPNDFNPDNLLKARQRLRVPGPADDFRFRLLTAGEERIVGICMAGERKSPPGLTHDFERQRFTHLGDWEAHLKRELEADAKERAGGGKVRRTKLVSRRRHGRDSMPARTDPSPLPQARAAIVIRID